MAESKAVGVGDWKKERGGDPESVETRRKGRVRGVKLMTGRGNLSGGGGGVRGMAVKRKGEVT